MVAHAKLSLQEWAAIRAKWENDLRPGYTWLVAEMSLPVSAPAVRKIAVRDGWRKKASLQLPRQKPEVKVSVRKVSVGKVSEKGETLKETLRETLPETTAQAVNRDPDEFGAFADMTDRQETFVREYLVDWNARAAAIRAGYSPATAQEQSSRLLSFVKVREAIQTLASARARRWVSMATN